MGPDFVVEAARRPTRPDVGHRMYVVLTRARDCSSRSQRRASCGGEESSEHLRGSP